MDHNLEGLVAITTTKTMEVEVEEFDLGLLRELVNLSNILCRDTHFSGRVVPKQINDLTGSVRVENILKMESKWLLGHLWIPCQKDIFGKATLLPEDWN